MAKNSMDLTQGSIFKKLVIFAFPILLTNLMQQLYHLADVVVVGNFAQDSTTALAAVGSTGSVTTLLLNLFHGLSGGSNVVCANYYGAKDRDGLRRAMHTAVVIAATGGVFISIVGVVLARPLLSLMGSPDSVIDHAVTYMRIIFLGQPASLMYIFCASILRAHGDTRRSMYILTGSGILNVLLNLFFVVVLHWDSAGVAVATVSANYVSVFVILRILFSKNGETALTFGELKIHWGEFVKIVRIGIPGGLNGMVFSVSNVIVASTINNFGDVVIAANSASASVDALVYQVILSFYVAAVAFSGQNYGARKLHRIDKLLGNSILLVFGIMTVLNTFITIYPEFFMGLFTSEENVIQTGIFKMILLGWGYIIYGVSEIALGCCRGMGRSGVPTALNMMSICVPRMLWVFFIFPLHPTFNFLSLCYPISWVISATAQLIYYAYARKSVAAKFAAEDAEKAEKELALSEN